MAKKNQERKKENTVGFQPDCIIYCWKGHKHGTAIRVQLGMLNGLLRTVPRKLDMT
jgi:hypothetical protein